jgi:hypothetical protein
MAERGEKLSRMEDKFAAMSHKAQEFSSLAEQIKAKQKGRGWGFF